MEILRGGLRRYGYVGPVDVLAVALSGGEGHVIGCWEDFLAWLGSVVEADLEEPFTFVVDLGGMLRLAARRSEHVGCAGGSAVLSAGEITFGGESGRWAVTEVSNQSTGFCPEVGSWAAVGAALDRVGLPHPGRFTYEFVFRRCLRCRERNVVRDGHFVCAVCDADLPLVWNFDQELLVGGAFCH